MEKLKRNSTSGSTRPITLKDVEEGAVNLRKVGEALAGLKGDLTGKQGGLALTVELTLAFSQGAERIDRPGTVGAMQTRNCQNQC